MTDVSKDVYLFWRTLAQMCKDLGGISCSECPASRICCNLSSCETEEDVKDLIDVVQKFHDDHPPRTYAEDYFEKFPNADRFYKTDGVAVPAMCIKYAYGSNASKCRGISCTDCWNRVMEEKGVTE